jgi:hypothetical protein
LKTLENLEDLPVPVLPVPAVSETLKTLENLLPFTFENPEDP